MFKVFFLIFFDNFFDIRSSVKVGYFYELCDVGNGDKFIYKFMI